MKFAEDESVWKHNAEVLRLVASGVVSRTDADRLFLLPPDGSSSSDPPGLVVDAQGHTWHAVYPPLPAEEQSVEDNRTTA